MSSPPPLRPDPDALLAAMGREDRGKLKIFLGAAPGVGKTYAMLSGARRLSLAHLDVVVGVVETHGRVETEALLDGLVILPRREVIYRGTTISEFDLDAALARHPALLIVDELAHSNAPDSRHPKRHQDVEELLNAGIDVWTAVNIQHLEGLSDVVSRITGVVVRETVPDVVLDQADEVVVVDITPAELITRLSEGRIYLPENAARAAGAFFKPGNLTALREIALRRTADRVDDQMVDHLRRNAVEGAWPTAERLMVCVGGDSSSEAVVRACGRLASGLNAPWVAVTLERTGAEIVAPATLQRIDETMRLAERLGADTARLAGRDLPDEILRYARRENITQIVIGRSSAGFWARLKGHSLSGTLLRRASDVAIHVIIGPEASARRRPAWGWPDRTTFAIGFSAAFGSVAAATLLAELGSRWLQRPSLSMIFLAAVLGCAVTVGQWPAIVAAILSFFAYNFFFIPPVYTFTIAEPHEVLALGIFLLVAVIAGGLTGRVRDQSQAARTRVTTIQALYDVSRKLSGAISLDDVLWIIARQAAQAIGGQVVILLGEGGKTAADLMIRAAFPPEDELGAAEWAAARWAFDHIESAGWRTGTLPNALFRFQPIRTSAGIVGVIGYMPAARGQALSAETERVLGALLDQGTLAIERASLVAESRRNETLAERERLQTTLLSSLSHDLRTPLASILGSVTSLRGYGGQMSEADRDDLMAAIEEEARRLARFVSNLLDMTRVESGVLDLKRDWVDVTDVVRAAVARAEKAFPGRTTRVMVEEGLPLVRGDPLLLQQALFNLLDNADKYSQSGSATTVRATMGIGDVTITVEDEGCGIPAADLVRVFEKFARVTDGDRRPPGTGLGLAVAQGVVDAMGGSIRAESPATAGKGTRIVIHLPVGPPQPLGVEEKELSDVGV
ncbi:sensor histidine kinase KdpD [Lichenifustis flavocetrariae]|uniref:histidine kinase n=1 Tax=Lichenifustis flavocetrariae TaxID=2949735 RepID=A0AA41YYD3_9HYPH|nr:sensor histidine kinase KdpD [Lichenifustis flavocetrariae]MCW6510844.1 sensor histidine kinase KdpD [Lichenifustis flavocetrariae]